MPMYTRHHHAICIAFCVLLAACRSASEEVGGSPESAPVSERVSEPVSDQRGSIVLDLENRTVMQPIGSAVADPTNQKFVQIEITDVFNPKDIRISFDLHYRPDDGEKTFLGSFSLYPPHNPGNFIVATGGKLRSEGSIELSMNVLDRVDATDEVRVTLKRMSFREK